MRGRVSPWVLLAGCLLLACDSGAGVSPRRAALDGLIEHVFLPMMGDFGAAAATLSERAEALCAAPGDDTLEQARSAWQRARTPVKQLEVVAFGPHTLPPWRLDAQFDFWPVRPDSIEDVLGGDQVLYGGDAGAFALGASTKGLPAIEYLLHGPGVGTASFETESRRCDYLRALTADLELQAAELEAVWRQEFIPALRIEGEGGRYETIGESFGEVANGLGATLDIIRAEKIGRPFGEKSGGELQPDKLESRYAPRSTEDILDTLAGVEAVFTGRYGDHRTGGLAELLRLGNRPKDVTFQRHMDASVAALRAIEGSLEQALSDDPEGVQSALDALRELHIFLQVDLTQALAVTVTFGGSDGD
ncbi:MAG: imelysin family protein [Myxococcales bacterium]|nr:imelysin family protein [Myxococcales bacterium]